MGLLYIPFWLNLYMEWNRVCRDKCTLHSILVKSIRIDVSALYDLTCFTFHSG